MWTEWLLRDRDHAHDAPRKVRQGVSLGGACEGGSPMYKFGFILLLACVGAFGALHGVGPSDSSESGCNPLFRGLYQCDDGSPDFSWYADIAAGEGLANQFTVVGSGIARIDTIFLAVDGNGPPEQTILLGVWNDAAGSPGDPLYLEPVNLTQYVPLPGTFVWVAIPVGDANIVVEDDFWIGYLDDLSLTFRPSLDDSGGCNTWYYDPIVQQWIDIDDHPLGLPPGLSLLFRCWAFEDVGIELISFKASRIESDVLLEWSTATETNTFGYYIMRSTHEQDGYVGISDLIHGAGTTSCMRSYHYRDTEVSVGVRYYYRLVDVDTAGNETTHGPITIRLVPTGESSWGEIKADFE